jgi:hypothetical protein
MYRPLGILALALLALFGAAPTSEAALLHGPRFRVGLSPCLAPCVPGCLIRVPVFYCVRVVAPAPVVVTPPAYMPPAPPQPVTLPGPVVSVPANFPGGVAPPPAPVPAARPMTHQEFAKAFQPGPGRYEVVLLHPGSKCPVTVCFTLPPGCPRVIVHKRELVFDYGRHEVEIRFQIGGKVRVRER